MTFLSASIKNWDLKHVDLPWAQINIARAMWMEGSDTKQISLALRCSEALVYNNLERIKP